MKSMSRKLVLSTIAATNTLAAVVQRVKSASVTVDGKLISQIAKGLLVFAAIDKNDTPKEVESMASKVLKVKFWEADDGTKWKKNVQEIEGELLCVSQFTLLASTKKGNKPSFHNSASPVRGKELYDQFMKKVRTEYREERVKDGVFQATMDVALVNDGPVTIEIETSPTEMKNPTGSAGSGDKPEENDTLKGHVHKTFEMPASLLE